MAPAADDPLPHASLLSIIDADLQGVEERLVAETRSDVGAVREISSHTLLSGGKRLRPALAILCARVAAYHRSEFAYPADRVVSAAAAAEMIHMATLMHDDVVDEAPERRGRPTASAVYGNSITILTGDFLLAKSMSLLAHNDDNLHIVRVFSDVTVAMAEGEVLQAAIAHDLDISIERYEEVIERKTARFLAGCCETGALLGGADPVQAAELRGYGHHLGMAFQIADDLLDFLGEPKKTGKPLGTDLRDGRVTLPLLHALAVADRDLTAHLRDRLCRPDGQIGDADIAAITAMIQRAGGFEAAQRTAEECAERAVHDLRSFPVSPYRQSLERLARFVIARDR
jgi:octaprenyl-diphosphate synthase